MRTFIPKAEADTMNLNQILTALGLTTRPAANGQKRILAGRLELFKGTAHDVYGWLVATGQIRPDVVPGFRSLVGGAIGSSADLSSRKGNG